MSVDANKLFNRSTILRDLTISINDYELSREDVTSLEIKYSMFDLPVTGTISFADNFQLASLEVWNGETVLNIEAADINDEIFDRSFRITGINSEQYNGRFRKYTLSFIDSFYYKIANTYISKSFNDTKTNAFKKYIEHLGLEQVLEDNFIEMDFDDTADAMPFVVPGNISVLDFFEQEFNKKGFRLYQTRSSIKLKKDDINSLDEQEEVFSDDTDNDMYGWKIHDMTMNYNNILVENFALPISKNVKFDYNKIEDYETQNLSDIYSTIEMNETKTDAFQHTTGAKLTTQAQKNIEIHKFDLEKIYASNNVLEIVVPGNFKVNDIGKLVNVELKGNPMIKDAALEGDTFHSGKYYVTALSDRFVGDKLVQKVVLNRADFGYVRKS